MGANKEVLLKDEETTMVPSFPKLKTKPTFAERIDPYIGLSTLFISAFFFSTGVLCVKLLTKRGVSSWYITLLRMAGQMTLAAVGIYIQGDTVFVSHEVLPYLIIRSFCGSFAQTLFYMALHALELGDANAIYFTCPFFGTLIAYLWLGEKITIWSLGMGVLSFAGFLLVARPEFLFPTSGSGVTVHENVFMWSCVALLGAVLAGFALAAIRGINSRATVMQMVFYFGFVGTLYLLPITIYKYFQSPIAFNNMYNADNIGLMLAVILATCIAQSLLNVGMSREKVGVGGFLRNLDIVFAYVFQVTILNRSVHMWSIIGSTLIIMSSVVVFVARFFEKRPSGKGDFADAQSPLNIIKGSISGSIGYNSCSNTHSGRRVTPELYRTAAAVDNTL